MVDRPKLPKRKKDNAKDMGSSEKCKVFFFAANPRDATQLALGIYLRGD